MSEDRFDGLIRVGLRIRENRKLRGLSLEEVAQRAGVTKSLLSKIENFRAIPSLPVLVRISSAMSIDMAELVRGIGEDGEKPFILTRIADRELVERDDAVGFLHEAIMARQLGEYAFDSIVLTLEPSSNRKVVTTEGYEFIYILEGEVEFTIGPDVLNIKKGDALFFDGRISHVPRNTGSQKAEILAIYLIDNKLR